MFNSQKSLKLWMLITGPLEEGRAPGTHSPQLVATRLSHHSCSGLCLNPQKFLRATGRETFEHFLNMLISKFALAFASSLHVIFFLNCPRAQLG